MRMRVVLAAGALAAIVPALAAAQQRPATPPARPAPQPAARPAAQPAQRPAARPAAAAAHREGSIELSVGGGVFAVDQALNGYLDQVNIADPAPGRFMFGGVGRLGYNLTSKLGLSVGSGFGVGNGASLLSPFGALTYTLDLNKKMSPFFTVGAGLTRFSGNSNKITATYGAHAGVGIRSMLGENMALRVEGRMAYENYEENGGMTAFNGAATVGLSYFMGGGPPRDTDADGVPDKRDRCTGTLRGATVDLRGCPSDTDRDGVWNGLDACPNTPANTPVDARGCTRDTDNDGVADNLDRCANTPANARPLDANGCPVDTDRDTVFDYLDRCANTPAGVPVDANGCPRDTDSDGVTDNNDRCANTPANARPIDATGCPVDSDGDRVFDYLDRCGNTAAGTQVDANGCPIDPDSDGDGVVNSRDRCSNTPAGARVDANGCPLADLPAVGAALVMRNISFRAGTARLLPTSTAELDRIAQAIVATPDSRWEVGGHTDAAGVAAANMRLSQQRAQAVLDYFVSKGVPASAMTAVGYGSTRGVAPNTTAAGRAQNRRVELKRLS